MNYIDPSRYILLVEPREQLYSQLLESECRNIRLCHSSKEAMVEYSDLLRRVDPGRIIVFLDTRVVDIYWENVLQAMYALSPYPNIVIMHHNLKVHTVVKAIRLGAWGVKMRQLTRITMILTVNEIVASPGFKKKDMDLDFSKLNWSTELQSDYARLMQVRVPGVIESLFSQRALGELSGFPEEMWEFLDLCRPYISKENMSLSQCFEVIERYIGGAILSLNKPRLVIIEDEWMIRDSLGDILEDQYKLRLVGSCEEAKQVFEEEEEVDLALLDVYLPDGLGTELYPELLRLKPNVEVVALTAFQDYRVVQSLIGEGCFDYINKPYDLQYLWQTLSRAWLRIAWPYFEDKRSIVELSYMQRMVFLAYLISQRRRVGGLRGLLGLKTGCNPYHQRSIREELYGVDILAIFPELYERMA